MNFPVKYCMYGVASADFVNLPLEELEDKAAIVVFYMI